MIKIKSYDNPFVYQVDNNFLPTCTGQVRWNGVAKQFEVCDISGAWYYIDNTVEIKNNHDVVRVVEWAKKQMDYEEKLEHLSKQYPAIKDLKEKLDLIVKLVENEPIKISE